MSISAAQVKELRERTGLGMMECKNALVETDGDIDKAIDLLRKRAGAKVEKKAGRTAAEGRVSTHVSDDRDLAGMAEINCETDFVAKEDGFVAFADAVATCVATHDPADLAALLAAPLEAGKSETVAQAAEHLVARLGEKIGVRRFVRYQTSTGRLDSYVHGARIGVLVELQGGDDTFAHDVAMHVAAMRPEYVSKDDVPPELAAKEKEILLEQVRDSGKPPEIMEKMVAGRLNKYLSEISLLGQPFVKDTDTTVGALLKSNGAAVLRFCRYEVGEGIEKRSEDFAAEVMAQVEGG
ncbi:MAG: translation elongation factor Ts [Gammaproteobacteria bacterium]|nr:MAG: translation elongation factor Ts [Gammaproteobacteria bacterium]